MKGNAVVFIDKEKVSFQEVDIPDPSSTDVVIEVEHSWISPGTESSFLRGERISGETMWTPEHPWPFPHVSGYQKVGRVINVGADVEDLQVGDKVFASVSHVKDLFFEFGGHINPAVTHHSQVWKIPEGEDPLAYSGLVLTQVGYNCGIRAPLNNKDVAVVIGDGLVGQWSAQTLLHRGADVVVLGRHADKLNLLPTEVQRINLQKEILSEVLPNYGSVSIIIDTVGSMETVSEILPFMKREGHWVSAGFLGNTGIVDIQCLREKEITLHTPSGWTKERMDQTLEGILEGWLKTLPLITHRFPSQEAAVAWSLILEKREPFLGVILDW